MLIHSRFKFISIAALFGVQLFFLGINSGITLADDLSDRQPKADNASGSAPPQEGEGLSNEHLDDGSDTQAMVNSTTHTQKPEQESLDPKDDGEYRPPLNLGYPSETMSSGTR